MPRHLLAIHSSPGLGGPSRCARVSLLLVLVTALGIPACAAECIAEDEADDPTRERETPQTWGLGSSYWGAISSRADSNTAVFTQPSKPLWEQTVLVPYHVVAVPFRLFALGLKGTIIYMDDHQVLDRIMTLIGPHPGPLGIAVRFQAGGLSGFGGGITGTHKAFFGRGNRLKLRWRSTTRGTHKASLGIHLRRDRLTSFVVGAGYRIRPNARYFGSGPDAPESMESFYTQETAWAGLSLRRQVFQTLDTEALLLFSGVGARGPRDDDEVSVREHFDPTPAGYGTRSEGLTLSLGLIRDTTAEDGRPMSGGIERLKVSYFYDTKDENAAFWTFRGEGQRFFGLWNSKQALAIRGYVGWIKAEDWDHVPFQRHLTNDDPDLLRGYQDFRWHGRGLTALSVEYRWPIWAFKSADQIGVDAYLFVDAGQVFNEFNQLSGDHVKTCYGMGIRLADNEFLGRVEVGWSNEEVVFRLRADQIFQYAKGGLLHGRDQVALR